MRSPTPRQRRTRLAAIAMAMLLLIGCDKEDVHQYAVPSENAPTSTAPMPMPPADHAAAPAAGEAPITYDVPSGWTDTGPASMRLAGFTAGDASDPVLVTVTSFGGSVGGVASNVRRWAGQVGAASPTDEQIAQMVKPFAGLAGDAAAADITGTRGRIYVVFTQLDGAMWFFKMTGSPSAVDTQMDAMRKFVSSVRFAGQAGEGADQ